MKRILRFFRTGLWSVPKDRITPELITEVKSFQRFVFGSNLDGNHAGGAAAFARNRLGAIQGKHFGPQGKSYAIPTVGYRFGNMNLESIEPYVDMFIHDAKTHKNIEFFVTPIGCGIAGFKPEEIAPMFKKAIKLKNVSLPQEFWDVLMK